MKILRKITTILFLLIYSHGFAGSKTNNIYNSIVAQDGSGDYLSIMEAINAAPENRDIPFLIFIKNGSYEEQIIIPENKPYIYLIGQDKEKTIIHYKLNVQSQPKPDSKYIATDTIAWHFSVHNPDSKTYKLEGSVVRVNANNFYSENISYINDWGVEMQNGPQALAMSSQADRVAFYNCKFRSFQDTWMTSVRNSEDRHYIKNCYIEGAVDYIYGAGDCYFETCLMYNVRSGSVIVAPCHNTKTLYGYVFESCIIDGNNAAANGKQKLGRPWHNAPIAVFLNTKVKIPLAPEGWTNMGTIPALFAEYNSTDINGNILNLEQRKIEYTARDDNRTGSCKASISAEESTKYTYQNIIQKDDQWNPRNIIASIKTPQHITQNSHGLKWEKILGAKGYIIYEDDIVIGFSKKEKLYTSIKRGAVYTVRAINEYGSLSLIY